MTLEDLFLKISINACNLVQYERPINRQFCGSIRDTRRCSAKNARSPRWRAFAIVHISKKVNRNVYYSIIALRIERRPNHVLELPIVIVVLSIIVLRTPSNLKFLFGIFRKYVSPSRFLTKCGPSVCVQ